MISWDIIGQLFNLQMLFVATLGTVIGVIFGAIPGLTGMVGISLLLPLTFVFPPQAGLLLLGGIYMGSMYGGSITAILINVPGSPEATFTAVEGFPLTKKGESQRALYHSIYACVFGGLAGVITLMFLTPVLARIAIKFGPPETLLLALSGLTIVGALAGTSNKAKSFFSTGLGVLISCIGVDMVSSRNRFVFNSNFLKGGISTISVVLGVFAISEMIINMGNKSGKITLIEQKKISRLEVLKEFFSYKYMLIKSSLTGIFIGILPGVGGTIASFISYGNAKSTSKRAAEYGNGSCEGIIANESANNAVVGSCLIPLLALGIPGSGTAAVMLGALTVHGIIPGPDLFAKRADVAYTFMIGMLFTVVIMGIIGILGIKLFSQIVKIKLEYIIPITIVFSMLGAYSDKNSLTDIFLAIIFAFIAVIMKKNEFPVAPMILGVVLGQLIEVNLRTTLVLSGASGDNLITYLLMRPLSVILLIFVAVLLIFMSRINKRATKELGASDD